MRHPCVRSTYCRAAAASQPKLPSSSSRHHPPLCCPAPTRAAGRPGPCRPPQGQRSTASSTCLASGFSMPLLFTASCTAAWAGTPAWPVSRELAGHDTFSWLHGASLRVMLLFISAFIFFCCGGVLFYCELLGFVFFLSFFHRVSESLLFLCVEGLVRSGHRWDYYLILIYFASDS